MSDQLVLRGFPSGYFIIRSVATKRLLDIKDDGVEDGTKVLLWPEKESSLVEDFRNPNANNQVFFIDDTGALCSRSSGHAIDIEGDRLVLRHRRPVSYPYPNAYAHPLPQFRYDRESKEITIELAYPPTTRMVMVSQPMEKSRTLIDDASEFINSAISGPINLFSGAVFSGKHIVKPDEISKGNIELEDQELTEEDRGEEGEVDDSLKLERHVKVVSVVEEGGLSGKARMRRQWSISSLRRNKESTFTGMASGR